MRKHGLKLECLSVPTGRGTGTRWGQDVVTAVPVFVMPQSLSADRTLPVSVGRSIRRERGLAHEPLPRAKLCVANSPHLLSR